MHGTAFIFPPGSGSTFNIRVRIQEDKFPKSINTKCKAMADHCKFCIYKCFKSKLNNLLVSYFSPIFYVFAPKRISSIIIPLKFGKLDLGLGLDPQLDPHSEYVLNLDPAPHTMNADPQPSHLLKVLSGS